MLLDFRAKNWFFIGTWVLGAKSIISNFQMSMSWHVTIKVLTK